MFCHKVIFTELLMRTCSDKMYFQCKRTCNHMYYTKSTAGKFSLVGGCATSPIFILFDGIIVLIPCMEFRCCACHLAWTLVIWGGGLWDRHKEWYFRVVFLSWTVNRYLFFYIVNKHLSSLMLWCACFERSSWDRSITKCTRIKDCCREKSRVWLSHI